MKLKSWRVGKRVYFLKVIMICWWAVVVIQIIILSKETREQKMSNMSSEYDHNFSGDESPEGVVPGKYIKKLKTYRKKGHKLISSALKKKKCQFYNMGTCTKGSLCKASHSFIPDIAKKICKSFLNNSCNRTIDCPYSHNTQRYPCKFFHIQRKCDLGPQCRFSHQEFDSDFQQEFLKDNSQFLVKLHKQGKELESKFIEYIEKNDLLNENFKKKDQNCYNSSAIPFMFGFPLIRTLSKEDSKIDTVKQYSRKPSSLKKPSGNQNLFSIRMVYKNRLQIPQKLPTYDQDRSYSSNRPNNNNQMGSSRQQVSGQRSDKISQHIQLTPQSKTNKPQAIQQFVCSYY